VLWRETLQVLLTPDHLDYRVMPALGLSPTDIGSIPCAPGSGSEPPGWKPACDALARLVDGHKGKPFRIEVQLSDRFVRYQVLEARSGIVTRAEWRSYARHAFATVHGDAAKDWDFRIDLVPPGQPSLACAIDNALIDTLRELAAKRTSRLVGVRPRFVKLFNRRHFATQQQDTLWFAVVEERHVCLGVQVGKTWRAVRNEAAPDGWQAALPGMIRRVRASLDQTEGGSLYLCGNLAAGGVPAAIEGLPVHAAETGFLRGRAVSVAAQES
jgi:hypothetical protein